jgi:fluoroacetyl-CoA thioesterase
MRDTLRKGLTNNKRIEVDRPRTIDFMGEDCRVYGTPYLLYDIEMTCRDILLDHGDKGEDSVGTHIELDHTGASLLGMWVDIEARLTRLDGRAASFEVTARDSVEEVARAKHTRYIVDTDKTAERLRKKLAAATNSG